MMLTCLCEHAGKDSLSRRPREGGDPCVVAGLDSRLRGNDGGLQTAEARVRPCRGGGAVRVQGAMVKEVDEAASMRIEKISLREKVSEADNYSTKKTLWLRPVTSYL